MADEPPAAPLRLEEAPAPEAAPTPEPRAPESTRVLGFDLARSFAIATMVLINFQVFLLGSPRGDHAEIWWRWLAHAPSGRSSATFVILAGCGIAQMSRRALATDDRRAWWDVRRTLFLRSLFLFCAGNLLILAWSIDILHFYAFYLLCAVPFVRARGWVLLGSSFLVTAATTAVIVAYPWIEERSLPYHSLRGMAENVVATGIHPLFPWMSFVLYGLWLGRQELGEPVRRRRFLVAGALTAVGTEIVALALSTAAVRSLLPVPAEAIAMLGTSWSPEPLYVVGACSTTTFVVALAHEVTARWPGNVLVRALVSTGQISLSVYVLHALVGVGIPRWGFDLENQMKIELVVAWWAVFIALVIASALVYRRFFLRGPIETVMRFLTGTGAAGLPWLELVRRLLSVARTAGRLRAVPAAVTTELAAALAETYETAAARLREAPTAPQPAATDAPRSPLRAVGLALAAVGAWVVLVARVLGTAPPSPVCPASAPLALGTTTTSQLTMLCPHVHFSLAIDRRMGVEITTRSGTDVLVEVHDAAGAMVASDDDGGPGLDARVHTVLVPGTYDVLVRPYSATSGPFVLAARELAAPGGP